MFLQRFPFATQKESRKLHEIRDFLNMINGDDKSVFKLTRSESIAMAEIMEKFLEQEKRMDNT